MVRWSSRALADLSSIGDYIARDKPHASRSWVGKIDDRAELAALQPFLGRAVKEFWRTDVREVFLGSYRIT